MGAFMGQQNGGVMHGNGGMGRGGNMVTIDGKQFNPDRIDINVRQSSTEVWEIYNREDMMGGMTHPFHVHGVQFRILERDGKPPPDNECGWKDTVAVAPG